MGTVGPRKLRRGLQSRRDEQRDITYFRSLCAPTVAVSSVHWFIEMACKLVLDAFHFDIENYFVESDLEEKRVLGTRVCGRVLR